MLSQCLNKLHGEKLHQGGENLMHNISVSEIKYGEGLVRRDLMKLCATQKTAVYSIRY